ncbi:hypothetical protein ACVWYH_003830 [Bradyrhizobium sp. GM24.11]
MLANQRTLTLLTTGRRSYDAVVAERYSAKRATFSHKGRMEGKNLTPSVPARAGSSHPVR